MRDLRPTEPNDHELLDCSSEEIELPTVFSDEPPEDETGHALCPHCHKRRINDYRAAAIRWLAFFDQALSFVLQHNNPRLAAWVLAIATGRVTLTNGITQRQLAERLGLTKAAVSKAVKNVQAAFGSSIEGIEPMPGQRSMDSCRNFARARNKQITNDEQTH